MKPPAPPSFAARLVRWQRHHGRHGLPWQGTRDAYRIWVSEVMLQQTRVDAALAYYPRFLERFPTVAALANAPEDEVLALWSGLGYYARARNLHRAAKEVVANHGGRFPRSFAALTSLPGVGRSTAGAIAAFASGERRAILDGNVRRVMARHAGIAGDPASSRTLARLWEVAEALLPRSGIAAYTQGLMDLGATLCTARNPRCDACPVARDCVARAEGRIAELPGRAKRAPRPHRRVAMLVVVSRGEVLLVKRPAPGIWGGLWSLPEAPVRGNPVQALRERFGLRPAGAERMDPFTHEFSHFTLTVIPWMVRIRGPGAARAVSAARGTLAASAKGEEPRVWLSLAELAGAALPAPVRALLVRLTRAGPVLAENRAGVPAAKPRRGTRAVPASRRC